jgi:hypothetical protein
MAAGLLAAAAAIDPQAAAVAGLTGVRPGLKE